MKEKMILNNLGLIHKAIRNLHCKYETQEEYEDYYQIGLIGLVQGVNAYDYTKPHCSYLYTCIANELLKRFTLNKYQKRYNGKREISIYKQLGENLYLEDILQSDANIEEEYIQKEKYETLYRAIDKLKPTYREIIYKNFGLKCKDLSVLEIAHKKGISRNAVYQKKIKALELLKKELEKEYKNEIV